MSPRLSRPGSRPAYPQPAAEACGPKCHRRLPPDVGRARPPRRTIEPPPPAGPLPGTIRRSPACPYSSRARSHQHVAAAGSARKARKKEKYTRATRSFSAIRRLSASAVFTLLLLRIRPSSHHSPLASDRCRVVMAKQGKTLPWHSLRCPVRIEHLAASRVSQEIVAGVGPSGSSLRPARGHPSPTPRDTWRRAR
ncbi:MAG: hypothetical protein H6Q86_2081 [candidate division NC10 bacterium]|nr:hypothetical protein [candidate division NC10 bacterium]